MNKMKKNILQLSIVIMAVLVLSTTTMAGGKKHHHYKWWNPFSELWSTIEQLQDQMNNINTQVDEKLAGFSPDGSGITNLDPGVEPLVCPGCMFYGGPIPEEIAERLPGAYLVGVYFWTTNLTGVDLRGANLSGAVFQNADLTGANLEDANIGPAPLKDPDQVPVTWNNTTCPDGTDSTIDNGGTCEGHLEF
jgi:hypothetical protein